MAARASSTATLIACVALGRRQDALGPRELHADLERGPLVDALGVDDAVLLEQRHQRRHAVVAQPAGVDGLGDELAAERVHLDDRGHVAGIAEVVGVDAAGQRRGRLGLRGDDPVARLSAQLAADEREREAGEVRAAAGAAR